jgi:thioredoxin 1
MEDGMQTWIAFALLGGSVSANIPDLPNWQNDYGLARTRAGEIHKPIAVFIGTGKEGWSKVAREGDLDMQVSRLLAQHYVCVYVDKQTDTGKELADAFEVPAASGLIISDRTGGVEAFHHSGALSRTDLANALEKYSDPDRRVRTTESHTSAQPVPQSKNDFASARIKMAGRNVFELSGNNWQADVVNADMPVVVDFWAPWCGPCQRLGPTVDRIADQFAGKVKVCKVNIDENRDLAAKYGVNSIPRVLIFKGSDQPVNTIVGLTSEAELAQAVNSAIGR